jgi:hypothetical protein
MVRGLWGQDIRQDIVRLSCRLSERGWKGPRALGSGHTARHCTSCRLSRERTMLLAIMGEG